MGLLEGKERERDEEEEDKMEREEFWSNEANTSCVSVSFSLPGAG